MSTLASVIGRGVVASRPAAGIAGQLYFATDVSGGTLQRDNGSTWDNIEGAGGAGSVATTTTLGTVEVDNNMSGTPVAITTASKAAASGVASLDSNTRLAIAQAPKGSDLNKIQLDYTQVSDITSLGFAAATNTDVIANQNFTVDDANSIVEISVVGAWVLLAGQIANMKLYVDGTFRDFCGAQDAPGNTPTPFTGDTKFSGLSAATHTVRIVGWAASGATFFCRPSTQPNIEGLHIQVIERK